MEIKTKAETFIGFAIRTGKFKIGTNAVATLKKAYLVIVCNSASENTKKEAEKLARKFGCPLIESKNKSLEQITHRENAKVMAISDKQLSDAVLSNSEEDFTQRI
ncbi:MAG: hypothetical protein E7373_00605 [Clostridiales bacterium]|nr:hypothetical protein [Clostridiales bacterium]